MRKYNSIVLVEVDRVFSQPRQLAVFVLLRFVALWKALSPTPEQDLDDPENMSEASRAKSSRGIPAVASVKGNGIGIEDEEDNNKIAEMGSRFLPKDAGPRDQNGEVENALRGMLVAPVLDTPVQDKTKYALRRKEGIAEDGFEEVMPGAGDGRRQRSAEVLTGLAKEVRDWSPGAIRELFIANLDRGGFGNKTAVAKTALGRRSQEPPFVKLEVLGVGKFGTVVCVRHKLFGVEYALKTVVEVSGMSSRLIVYSYRDQGQGDKKRRGMKNTAGLG